MPLAPRTLSRYLDRYALLAGSWAPGTQGFWEHQSRPAGCGQPLFHRRRLGSDIALFLDPSLTPPSPSKGAPGARLRSHHPTDTSILKFVIVGDAAVGKSCLLIRLTDDRFAASEPTLGVEFGSRLVSTTVGGAAKRVKVQCELRTND